MDWDNETKGKLSFLGKVFSKIKESFAKTSEFEQNQIYAQQQDQNNIVDVAKLNVVKTTLADWLSAVDILHQCVERIRNEIDLVAPNKITLEIIGTSTYLLQINLLLAKIKNNFVTFQKRQKELTEKSNAGTPSELTKASQCCTQCYTTLLQLVLLTKDANLKILKSKDLIDLVQVLEVEAQDLGLTMQTLNEYVLNKDPLHALFDNTLLEKLLEAQRQRNYTGEYGFCVEVLTQSNALSLRENARKVEDVEQRNLLYNFIQGFETLSRCYVVERKEIIHKIMHSFRRELEELIGQCGAPDKTKDKAYCAMYKIFGYLDAIRFNTKRKDNNSVNMNQKALIVIRQFKSVCKQSPLGKGFLLEYQLSPKDKLQIKKKK